MSLSMWSFKQHGREPSRAECSVISANCVCVLRRQSFLWCFENFCGGLGWEEYRETLFGEEYLHFRYHCIGLPELHAEEYLATQNAVAYGLVPLMEHGDRSKPQLKAICLKGILRSDLNEVQAAILVHFLETYLPLEPAEEQEFQQLIPREEVETVKYNTPWHRQGRLDARREILLRLLRVKFGSVSSTTEQRVLSIKSTEELDRLLEQLIHAESIEKMELPADVQI